jgi:hypothetical protein
VVLVRVLLTAHPEHPDVEETDGCGQYRLSLEIIDVPQPARQTPAKPGEQIGELEHPLELGAIAVLAPARVIQVLPASGGVDTGGLQVAERVRADPHVFPRRRDDQVSDALEILG